MTVPALQFDTSIELGELPLLIPARFCIDVEEPTLMTRVGVGNLIAVRGATEREFLIGITERLTRNLRDEMLDDKTDEKEILAMGPQPEDAIRVVLIGTFRTIQGDEPNVFKRGADSFPQIDRECFLIEGRTFNGSWGFSERTLRRMNDCSSDISSSTPMRWPLSVATSSFSVTHPFSEAPVQEKVGRLL